MPWTASESKTELERRIAIGAIVSDPYLAGLAKVYQPQWVTAPFVRRVLDWCVGYFKQHRRAPRKDIGSIFHAWARDAADREEVTLIGDLLEEFSEEWEDEAEEFNHLYLMDKTLEQFRATSMTHLAEDLLAHLSRGDLLEAERVQAEWARPASPRVDGIDPYADEDAIRLALAENERALFELPGAYGEFINPQLVREALVAFMGPEKRGKTFFLLDLAHWASRARRNVAFFQAGDMSQNQYLIRQLSRVTGKTTRERYAGEMLEPVVDCHFNQRDNCARAERTCATWAVEEVPGETGPPKFEPRDWEEAHRNGYRPCVSCRDKERGWPGFWPAVWHQRVSIGMIVQPETAVREMQKHLRRRGSSQFRLSTHPNDTLTVETMDRHLQLWEDADGFVPDVIVVDYADIMASERDAGTQPREQINKRWKALRRLAQQRRALVATATQSDTESYEAETLKTKHFSDDKRKFGHVTAMFSLNQTADEKERGIMRVGNLVLREDRFDVRDTVTLLMNLTKSAVCLDSFFTRRKKVPTDPT